ncbi:MAG: ribose 5-phosphate isomerase B [Myxococcota bacterium]|nr:ribose 5-phosphate isomerase B [Myxococcota bacterium]MDW8361293.1 ribose 5-phosphate isomerase B [Myxococcales bacterium]
MSEGAVRRVAFGCDHAGFALRQTVVEYLRGRGFEVLDFGTDRPDPCDYPDIAHAVARALAEGRADRAVLVCGSGVGMSMAANRHRGVRAVLCSEPLSARLGRAHNDANALCFGARIVGPAMAVALLDAFFDSEHEGGRHARRAARIDPESG